MGGAPDQVLSETATRHTSLLEFYTENGHMKNLRNPTLMDSL